MQSARHAISSARKSAPGLRSPEHARYRESCRNDRGTIGARPRKSRDGAPPVMISEKAPPHKTIRIMSGMRPTGRLHIGHLVGALASWVEMANSAESFFEIA